MSNKTNILPLDGCANLINELVNDFCQMTINSNSIPKSVTYKVASRDEPFGIERGARKAALLQFKKGLSIKKYAFDIRRINQETDRNPRENLQYYRRSEDYIDSKDEKRLNLFAKLLEPLDDIKNKFASDQDYLKSHVKKLHENVIGIMEFKKANSVFRPQMDYMEQLLYARYRISLSDLDKYSYDELYDTILSKDLNLFKKSQVLGKAKKQKTSKIKKSNDSLPNIEKTSPSPAPAVQSLGESLIPTQRPIESSSEKPIKSKNTGNSDNLQGSIVNAIFGNENLRSNGERKVERTITITIRDEVMD